MSDSAQIIDMADPPEQEEFSASTPGRDITKPWIGALEIEPFVDHVLNEQNLTLERCEEILTDDQVMATFQQRRLAVTGLDWEVQSGDEDDPRAAEAAAELEADLKRINWDRITDQVLFGIFFGFSVAEVMWTIRDGRWAIDDILVRNRVRFEFGQNGRLFLKTLARPEGEEIPAEKFWIHRVGASHADNPHGRGLAHYLYWPVLFKRDGVRYWMTFLDKFGGPTILGKLPKGQIENQVFRDKVLETLRSIQTDSAAVIPDSVIVELLEATRGGTADYQNFGEFWNAAISKVVLSSTMTVDAEGGQYKGEVHKAVRDEVLQGDSDELTGSFARIAKMWTDLNYGDEAVAAPIVKRRTEQPEDTNETAERDERLANIGYVPTPERIARVYGTDYERVDRDSGSVNENQVSSIKPLTEREFREALAFADPSAVDVKKASNRAATAAIFSGADSAVSRADAIVGRQIQAILKLIDESEDAAEFSARLPELFAADPDPVAIETIRDATFMARVVGLANKMKPKEE